MERFLLPAVLGVAALVAGIAVAFGGPAVLGVVGGALGAVAAGWLVAALARGRAADRRIGQLEVEVGRLRGEVRQAQDARDDAEARLEWRTQLTALRRSTETDRLTDEVTGLLAEGWFVVALESRIATARRNLRPVAVVLIDVVTGLERGRPTPADPRRVTAALTATIRESDDAFRLRDGGFALLLEDTTDAGATWTAERVRKALTSVEPNATVWAGVSCYPAHGLTTDEVLDRADHALDAAREWPQHRIEVARAEG